MGIFIDIKKNTKEISILIQIVAVLIVTTVELML